MIADFTGNLTTMFGELPLLERPAAARAAGFESVEFWWPFGVEATPDAGDVEAFIGSIEQAGVRLYAMNLFAGDMPSGERGILSYPEDIERFRASVDVAMRIGSRLGVRMFNAPYGHRREDLDPAQQDDIATSNLVYAMHAAVAVGAMILLEPVSGFPLYPLKVARDVELVIERVVRETELTNIGLLLDQYHLTVNGDDVMRIASEQAATVHHVQIADVPGRHEPGSGAADIRGFIETLRGQGYEGSIALEYFPEDSTSASLERLQKELRRWSQ